MPRPAWDIQGLRKPNNAEAELLDELQVFILLEKLEWDQGRRAAAIPVSAKGHWKCRKCCLESLGRYQDGNCGQCCRRVKLLLPVIHPWDAEGHTGDPSHLGLLLTNPFYPIS